MYRGPRSPGHRGRLEELAREAQVPLETKITSLQASYTIPKFEQARDRQLAEEFLRSRKEAKLKLNSPIRAKFGLSKPKLAQHDYQEVNEALGSLVHDNGPPGVAEVLVDMLIEMGGDVNISRRRSKGAIKRMVGTDQTVERSRVLQVAVENRHIDMVHLLARRADDVTLDESVEIAINARHPIITRILLEHGANAGPHQAQFKAAVERGDGEMVDLMIRAAKPIAPECITESLVLAKFLPIASILARNGADGDYQGAAALMQAIRYRRLDLCIAIVLGQNPPSALSLDRGVGLAFSDPGTDIDTKFRLVEVLLCGGAAGDTVATTLVQCCREEYLGFIKLLVGHGTSVDYNGAKGLCFAVKRGHLEMVDLLLLGTLGPEHATSAFSCIEKSAPQEVVCSLMSRLLKRGAQSGVLDKALVEFVEKNYLDAVKILIRHGASVDHEGARALQYAISTEQITIVTALLEGQPSRVSLEKVFPHARNQMISREGRLVMTKSLLEAGVRGQLVDDALLEAVQDNASRDDRLIAALVLGGANAHSNEGQCLQAVVRQADVGVLKLLLQSPPSAESASSSIPVAMGIKNTAARYEIIKLLLSNRARGDRVAGALVESIAKSPAESDLHELLLRLGRADVNFNGGESICTAVRSLAVGTLKRLVEFGTPNATSISNALPNAIKLRSSDSKRADIVKLLLQKVRPQHAVSAALIEELRINRWPDDNSTAVLELLLEVGANVNYRDGEAVRLAVKSGSVERLKLLLAKIPNMKTLENSFPSAITLRPVKTRNQVCQMLLASGVSVPVLNQALVTTMEGKESGAEDFTALLLGFRPSVDFDGGRAICLATKNVLRQQLKLLMGARPKASLGTLQSAFSIAMDLPVDADRFDIFQILLEAGVLGGGVNEAMIREAARGDPGLPFCNLLLHYGASVEHSGGQAVHVAASSGFIATLELLLTGRPSLPILTKAFGSAWTLERDRRYTVIKLLLEAGMVGNDVDAALVKAVEESPCDRRLVKLLLEFKASILPQAAIHCATHHDHVTLAILLESGQSEAVTLAAFDAAMRAGNVWQTPDGLIVMQLLLGKSTIGGVDAALVEAAMQRTQPTAHNFADLLSRHGANVDYNKGQALQIASHYGDEWFIRKLLSMSPSTESMSMAFPYLFISSPSDEQALIDLVNLYVEHTGEQLDVGFSHPLFLPVLFLSLDKHPRWAKVLDTLINAGYPVNQQISRITEGGVGQEHKSLLFWALDQEQKRTSDPSIDVLIDHGANVNFIAPLSKKTPLSLAASALRYHVVQRLVQKGADPAVIDIDGMSPLAYASQKGDQSIVQELVAGAERNDGSLHDATRELRVETMQTLLAHGHHPDFPSMRHNGRNALGELCRNVSKLGDGLNKKKVGQAIRALLDAKADIKLKMGRRSVLLLALDNPDPYPVTEAVLKNFMWEGWRVKEDFNLYCAANGHCYSPTMYVKKGICESPPSEGPALIKLLESFGCEDHYYAMEGPQPEGCIGLPSDITEAERKRRDREQELADRRHDHELRLQQEREREAQAQMINQQRHALNLKEGDESTEREVARLEHVTKAKMRLRDQESVQEATLADSRYKQQLEYETSLGNQRLSFKQKENAAALEWAKSVALVEQRALEAREEIKSKARRDLSQQQIGWAREDVD